MRVLSGPNKHSEPFWRGSQVKANYSLFIIIIIFIFYFYNYYYYYYFLLFWNARCITENASEGELDMLP